ncbi:hypothetical protein AOL_s00110g139 [Orbilia oligospora ATCC 24927]|uniref:F-box domain-containing protein n=1 Tax=Arthrobotrys oligospora (strain ATCC 24927 / CBS 115.81 / DSM 1491) TaxID=756982 RepID=G1XKW9_ARTOA|nr:hypothetical protein AOL_s00110g139 [Orbilia oligospora ATCC 24927]EGX46315.1 hypothetical protein AOL_s00110g139 [Orbilia oligospora ATCC 24927]
MATATTIENLPTEVILKVFGHLDTDRCRLNTLSKTMRVCKRWKDAVEPLLYARLYLNFCLLDLEDENDGEDDDVDDPWKTSVSKNHDDLRPHLFHEGLFLRCAGFVRDLAIEFDDVHGSGTIDTPNLTQLIKRTSPFKNITSLTCKGSGSNVSLKRFWTFLGLTESLFPQLQCLTISRVVRGNSGPGAPPVRSNPTNSFTAGKRTGSLKEIKISLDVFQSDGHHIHEIFGNIVETFGMEAAGLVSEVDLYLEDTGAVRRHRRQTGNLKYLKLNEENGHNFEEDWRVNNLRRLKYTDCEGLYLVPDLIFVDGGCFEKLRWLEVSLSNWFIWRDELKRFFSESPTSPAPFPNVEIFKLNTRGAVKANPTIEYWNKSGDNKWFRDLLDESLIFFPRLRDFRAGTENMRRCYIERNPDGELVIGKDFFC